MVSVWSGCDEEVEFTFKKEDTDYEYYIVKTTNDTIKHGYYRELNFQLNKWDKVLGYYKHGKEDGRWVWYDEHGRIKEGNYKDGEKDGKWVEYDENGKIRREINYKDGQIVDGDFLYDFLTVCVVGDGRYVAW